MDHDYLIKVKDLKVHFPIEKGLLKGVVGYVKAVDGVSFTIKRKETFGLVGESGCGKTTVARSMVRAINFTSGDIIFNKDGEAINMGNMDEGELSEIRRDIQLIFQDPYSSLNPRMTVREIIGEPLTVHKIAKGKELDEMVIALMKDVGLDPKYLSRYPQALSGGQRQRVGIARALGLKPKLILADEPTSALDVSVQAQILNLLQDLQEEYDLSYLFISHDLSVVEHICDRVALMYAGVLVEMSGTEELFDNPRHPYTEALLSSIPDFNPRNKEKRTVLKGDVADRERLSEGCAFHPRCTYAIDICKKNKPELRLVDSEHWVACHLTDRIKLRGIIG